MSSEYDKLSDDFQEVTSPVEVMLERLDAVARRVGRLAWIQHRLKTIAFDSAAEYYINPHHESEKLEDTVKLDPRDTYETVFMSYHATRIPPEDLDDTFHTTYTITAVFDEPLESMDQIPVSYYSEVARNLRNVYDINDNDSEDNNDDDEDEDTSSTATFANTESPQDEMAAESDTEDGSTIDTVDEAMPIIRQKHRHTYNIRPHPFAFSYEQSFDYDIGNGVTVDGPYFDSEQAPKIVEIHDQFPDLLEPDTVLVDQRDPDHESLEERAVFNDEELFNLIHSNLGELSYAGNSDEEHARRVLGMLSVLMPGVFDK